jgi:acyl carrier protein
VTRAELYATLDDILEMPIGTLTGEEDLASLHRWDSLAVVSFIATVNGLFNVVLPAQKVKVCKSVPDLVALVNPHLTD